MSSYGNRHELARYELPTGEERIIFAQRINGKVAVTDVPERPFGRVFLIERHAESQAALDGLVSAYVHDSIERGEPAALIPELGGVHA